MWPSVRWMCGSASKWAVMQSAPARANASTWSAGRSTIRCTSMAPPASCTWSAIAAATSGPIVIGGTKWPSITSTWMTRAPAPSPRRPARRAGRSPPRESTARRDALRRDRGRSPGPHTERSIEWPQCWQSMSWEVLIRTIVWCSPQLGHCETSS